MEQFELFFVFAGFVVIFILVCLSTLDSDFEDED